MSSSKAADAEAGVSADAVMAELQGRVRERVRLQLLQNGGSKAFEKKQPTFSGRADNPTY